MLAVWKGGSAQKLEDEMVARVREEVISISTTWIKDVFTGFDWRERFTSQVADEEIIVLPDLQQALDIGLPGDIVVICRFQTSSNSWK